MIVSNAAEQWQQWLNTLKVGDEVVINYGRRLIIAKIIRITPTRRFMVDGKGCVFGNDGIEMGKHRWGYTKSKMQPVTDLLKETIARDNTLGFIENFKFDTLTTQQLLDVLKVIKPSE